jgi:hypothetical protein
MTMSLQVSAAEEEASSPWSGSETRWPSSRSIWVDDMASAGRSSFWFRTNGGCFRGRLVRAGRPESRKGTTTTRGSLEIRD